MRTTALMTMGDSEEIMIFSVLSLLQAFNTFLKASCDLEAFTLSQQAIHQHAFKIALAIGEAFKILTHIRYVEPRTYNRLALFQQLKFGGVFNGNDRNFLRHVRLICSIFQSYSDIGVSILPM
jgi:hypothetical protein